MLKQSRNALTCLAKRYRAVLRRCRLRALALALACALTALPPLPAGAANSGGTDDGNGNYIGSTSGSDGQVSIDSDISSNVYGGKTLTGNAMKNTVIIENGVVQAGRICGGESSDADKVASENTVIINGGTVRADGTASTVYGGNAPDGSSASDNTVTINGGLVELNVVGGQAGDAIKNRVYITAGTVTKDVIGGHAASGNSENNTVSISGGTVQGNVYGGRVQMQGGATNNTVILAGKPNLSSSPIYGGYNLLKLPFSDIVSGNLLEVRTSGLTVRSIQNFAAYAFVLPATIQSGDVLLTATNAIDLTNDGKTSSPDIQRIDVDGGATSLRAGDSVTLLQSNAGLNAGTLPESVSGTQGVTLYYTFALTTQTDASGQTVSVVATVKDVDTPDTPMGNGGVHVNPQTKALSEGHLSGVALTLQGADLAAGKGMEAARQAVRASLAGGGKGLAAFGALSGGWSRYNTGSHIDVSGFSLLTGLAWGADSVLGQFTTGMFFEFGSAATGTYNSFSNAASVSGDGSSWYMGAGLLARMDFTDSGPGHFYAEASGRAGALNNSYRNDDLRDGTGRRAEFDTSTPYVSLHAGLGYIWNLTDALSLDLHAKYFWTWQDSADPDLSTGEALHFDAVNSHRLRLGGRLTYSVNEHIRPYVGAAWEHEFDGTARATSLGYSLDAPSLKGDTGIGELGLSWTPSATTPLTVDLSVQGYTGIRQGYTGSFMAKWEF